ncbi:MAG: hypothetical protein ACK56I_00300, partial [bacterium]
MGTRAEWIAARAECGRAVAGWVRPPATDLHLERFQAEPGPNEEGLGFTHGEMARIVARILEDIG